MLVRKYFVIDTNTGEHMHRDLIAENRIKRSYAYKRMQESLEEDQDQEKDDDFYTDLGLPPMPRMNATHFDDAGREWTYTIKGWEITENEYDPVVKMEKLEVVVAKSTKQPWLDITNKSLWPEYKWDWFEDNASGDTGWGNSKVDHGLGNERGENSTIYGSWDNEGIGINWPGSGATFNNVLTDVNRIANLIRGFRVGRGIMQHGTALYDEFKPKTQYQLDSIRQDSIWQNTPIQIDSTFVKNYQLERLEWGVKQPKKFQPDSKLIWILRKDSIKKTNSIRSSYDSVKKNLGFDD